MKAEFQKIFNLFEEMEKAGQAVTLTFTSRGGKSTVKLQLESSTSTPSTAQPSPPAPGQGRRHRGSRARARRNQRAAAHQASLAEAATSVPLVDPLPPRPLHHLPSPTSESGRRQVTRVERPHQPTFSALNLDGSSSPPPTSPTPPSLLRPPLCYNFDCRAHCEDYGRCYYLCVDNIGCYCWLDEYGCEAQCFAIVSEMKCTHQALTLTSSPTPMNKKRLFVTAFFRQIALFNAGCLDVVR